MTQTLEGEAAPGWFARSGPLGFRRSALVAAGVLFFAVVGGGVTARTLMEPAAPAPAAVPVAAPQAPVAAPPAPKVESAPPKKVVARSERRLERTDKPTAAAGRVELAVAPWGEVLVDGKSRGVSPPLRVLDLPAGTHTVEIRNSTFPVHVEQVHVKAGEAVRIRHRFR